MKELCLALLDMYLGNTRDLPDWLRDAGRIHQLFYSGSGVFMKRFFVLSVLALAVAVNLLPASALAAGDDASVRDLWIKIPGLPEADSAVFNGQPGGEGEAYFERTMNDGGLFAVSIERIYANDSASGTTLTPADTAKLAVRLAALRNEITLKEEDVTSRSP
jgi:hypothetical protein